MARGTVLEKEQAVGGTEGGHSPSGATPATAGGISRQPVFSSGRDSARVPFAATRVARRAS